MDVYAHVIPGMDAKTANLVADMVIGSTDDGRYATVEPPLVDESVDNGPDRTDPGKRGGGRTPCSGRCRGDGVRSWGARTRT
jgi:hypothetical protein